MRIKFTIDNDNNVVILTTDNEEIYIKVEQDGNQKIVFVSSADPEYPTNIILGENI